MHIAPEDIEKSRSAIESAKILLVQMEINLDALCRIIEIAHRAGVFVILNPAPAARISDAVLAMVDVVTPNETEAEALTGVAVRSEADARRAAAYSPRSRRQKRGHYARRNGCVCDGRKEERNAFENSSGGDRFYRRGRRL